MSRSKESLTVYTAGFRGYGPLNEDDTFDHEYVGHGERAYADDDVHVNTGEVFAKINLHPTSERWNFERVSVANPVMKGSKSSSKLRFDVTNNPLPVRI